MGKEELAAKYGTSKNLRSLVNAAIRAELLAGSEVIEALTTANELDLATRGIEGIDRHLIGSLLARLRAARELMAGEIARRYDLPPPPSTN